MYEDLTNGRKTRDIRKEGDIPARPFKDFITEHIDPNCNVRGIILAYADEDNNLLFMVNGGFNIKQLEDIRENFTGMTSKMISQIEDDIKEMEDE